MKPFNISEINKTKYLFFTGKGGVGKTSVACASAIGLADKGYRILLISTDPASNLQDVFNRELSGQRTSIEEVPGLTVVNLNPEEAAAKYRDKVLAPYLGKLPESAIRNIEEQLSGSCTVEIAAFNEFSDFITDKFKQKEFDHIIFDTAPTGHTLRILQLPSAWSSFINGSTHGASCLGQLSGLEDRKNTYKQAVKILTDEKSTQLILVSRPEKSPLQEAARSSHELRQIGLNNQILIVNGVIQQTDTTTDKVYQQLLANQKSALNTIPESFSGFSLYSIPLRSYALSDIANIRKMLDSDSFNPDDSPFSLAPEGKTTQNLINDLYVSGKRVIFIMGKGGVGKTTLATATALGLAKKGVSVHLTTTDPANHLNYDSVKNTGISVSHIDEKKALEDYRKEVLKKAGETMGTDDLAYIEEDLQSPCTQEIAVFKAFAQIVEKSENEIIVIDTAPTGHTLLLLDATESYHKEVERTQWDIPKSIRNLLPRLRNPEETEVIIVTLPEATPIFEAERLQIDLKRAGIHNKWWIVNSCLSLTKTHNPFLKNKAGNEIPWIEKVRELSSGHMALVGWKSI